MQTLKESKIGSTLKVVKIEGEGAIKRRIMDMGITKGTVLVIRKVAPLGDPRLRFAITSFLFVKPTPKKFLWKKFRRKRF